MNFSVHFKTRDFSAPLIFPAALRPDRFSFTASGGCDRATITATSTPENLLKMVDLLRCPVTITDHESSHVWWGFVNSITIFLENVQTTVTLDRMFNKVKVTYSFISPDNKLADQLETTFSEVQASQNEYGIKEIVLHHKNIDEDFANNLRDTFLAAAAWPKSQLSQRNTPGTPHAVINCSGWFSTLAWQSYQNLEGFYAQNYTGPGAWESGRVTTKNHVGQFWNPIVNYPVKYVYFQLQGINFPARNVRVRLHTNSTWQPGAITAYSDWVNLSGMDYRFRFSWVRFTFDPPVAMIPGVSCWATFDPNGVSTTEYFFVRVNETQNITHEGNARYWDGAAWQLLTNITNPGQRPQLMYRAVCVTDTGDQLIEISSAANQHFSKITSISSGVLSSPYRDRGFDCLKEALLLMDLGTSNNRKITATVTEDLQLHFTEQPDPNQPTIYMDRFSKFHSLQGTSIKPYKPPVGQFAALSATDRFIMPFDRERLPLCFIQSAEYFPQSGRLRIKAI